VTSDQSGVASKDEDYVILSTIHSAKGQEWDFVYVLNVADGNFPSEFSNGKPELIEEERRLLYVAMTRARNELHVCAPLKYAVTQQAKDGDAHVYGAKSRFMTDKVMDCFERVSFRGSRASDTLSPSDATVAGAAATVDVGAQLKEMW
jgi:DNA helicase II / ATP-dependent DNA helicase PcrA